MKKKNAAAVALGRLGGRKKVAKGTAMMDDDKKREIAMKGVEARRAKAAQKGAKKK